MVKALHKDTIKEIINTRKRFLSILLIVLLGVGFFAGIRATSPDMKKTADTYFDETKMMDIEVISTTGLTDDNVKGIQDLEDVEIAEGTYSKDVLTKVDDEEFVLKVHTLSYNINCVKLQQGEMPKDETECVVEESFLKGTNKQIGDTITIEAEDTFGYCTELYPDVEYAEHSGKKLHLQIMTPTVFGQDLKWPLIVYVQGSSWHKQKLFQSLPTLARMCERGYAIAIVEHRESELAPFPAQVIDVKTAIRFLRLNGRSYHIDTDKISLWGDSSGAHSALIAGITGDTKYLPDLYQ